MKLERTKIECAMAAKALSYKALAEKLSCTPQNLSHIINRGTCSIITAAKLSAALGVDPAELLADSPSKAEGR